MINVSDLTASFKKTQVRIYRCTVYFYIGQVVNSNADQSICHQSLISLAWHPPASAWNCFCLTGRPLLEIKTNKQNIVTSHASFQGKRNHDDEPRQRQHDDWNLGRKNNDSMEQPSELVFESESHLSPNQAANLEFWVAWFVAGVECSTKLTGVLTRNQCKASLPSYPFGSHFLQCEILHDQMHLLLAAFTTKISWKLLEENINIAWTKILSKAHEAHNVSKKQYILNIIQYMSVSSVPQGLSQLAQRGPSVKAKTSAKLPDSGRCSCWSFSSFIFFHVSAVLQHKQASKLNKLT